MVNQILFDAIESCSAITGLLSFRVFETMGQSVANLRGVHTDTVIFDDCQDKDAP